MANPFQAIKLGNSAQELVAKRFETGRIVSIAGGIVTLDVGYYHPDGSAQYLELPYAYNFVPEVDQMATIVYPNDNPNGAYVVAVSEMAQYNPEVPTYVFTITLNARINQRTGHVYVKVAEWINQTGKSLTVLGVSFSLAQSISRADGADFRLNESTQLSSPVSLSSAGVAVAGTLSGTPVIATNDLAQLYVSTEGDNHSYCMILTVSAPL